MGNTSLIEAVNYGSMRLDRISLLMTFGVDPYIRDMNGHTALDNALLIDDYSLHEYLKPAMIAILTQYNNDYKSRDLSQSIKTASGT